MVPNLGNVIEFAAVVAAIIVAIKKARPQLAGAATVIIAGVVSLALALLHMAASGPFSCARLEAAILLAIGAWLGAVLGSWWIRLPQRGPPGSSP